MNNFDKAYLDLMKEILEYGSIKEDRTGTGTISIFGKMLEFDMSYGAFPLLTTKKVYWKGVVHELLWFLSGNTNIKYLVNNGVNIWNGNAYDYFKKVWSYSNASDTQAPSLDYFLYRVKKDSKTRLLHPTTNEKYTYGDLGNVYGAQWRNWNKQLPMHLFSDHPDKHQSKLYQREIQNPKYHVDQISNVIEGLKNNPDSRRHIVSAWNVAEIQVMALPPCHTMFQFYSEELSFNSRWSSNNYKPYDIENEVEYLEGYDYITQEQFENFHHNKMDELGLPKRKLSLLYNMRSNDIFLGAPFNIASYALLLKMVAQVTNHSVGKLKCSLGDCHIYSNHITQVKEQLTREPFSPPTIELNENINNIDAFRADDIFLKNYKSHPSIKAPMAV